MPIVGRSDHHGAPRGSARSPVSPGVPTGHGELEYYVGNHHSERDQYRHELNVTAGHGDPLRERRHAHDPKPGQPQGHRGQTTRQRGEQQHERKHGANDTPATGAFRGPLVPPPAGRDQDPTRSVTFDAHVPS